MANKTIAVHACNATASWPLTRSKLSTYHQQLAIDSDALQLPDL
ncbi:MAG: lipopolysaccharide export system protein LptA [Gammaproteobacteria bacterium]|jgi:lipopolysaccharide export system protein LptA